MASSEAAAEQFNDKQTGAKLLTGNHYLDEKINEWLEWDQNETTRKEIEGLVTSSKYEELCQLLLTRATFGTAGIRGVMRAGYACMNDLVIIQTSQGLAEYLMRLKPEVVKNGIIIGHDARHNSRRFAHRTAAAFLHRNIPTYLFGDIVPTPFIPFGIKLLGCTAGVMVTASHNPKDDNGYKVYFANGAQITSPHDKGIQSTIEENLKPWPEAWDLECIERTEDPMERVKGAYYEQVSKRILDAEVVKSTDLKFTYTALHGVGHRYLTEALTVCGFPSIHSVKEQQEPDPEFSTVTFPNPEEGKGVLDLSIKTANAVDGTIILANDPDADRCAVAERQPAGEWRIFNGNEIGALLGWWFWFLKQRLQPQLDPAECYMISSAVSSKVLQTMAKKEGFQFIETLTGFKWMGNRAHELEQQGRTVLFAFEEAIGYMCGTSVLDKDGISAAVEVAQMAAHLRSTQNGRSLSEHLKFIYSEYGYHTSLNSYYICHEPEIIKRIFTRLANFHGTNTYPDCIGVYRIKRVRDLNRGFDSLTSNNIPELPSSSSSYMLTFYFENGVVLTIRTSGTEPKIKYYTEAIAEPDLKNWQEVDKMLIDLVWNMIKVCLEPEKNGLKARSE
ncbi:Phosphoglucomutase-2 [Halotydeus destructor]|nr:Phosphoglucomutase-2 [Halotydeus destructor]